MQKDLITKTVQDQLRERDVSSNSISNQILQFQRGNISVELVKPAVVNEGIVKLNKNQEKKFIRLYENSFSKYRIVKFVPASGAATRMFKDIISEYANIANSTDMDNQKFLIIDKLLENLSKFAFYEDLKTKDDINDKKKIIENILFEDGLNYSNLPKGLIKFHKYADSFRTAFEEHLVEGREYLCDNSGNCNIHFTVTHEYKTYIEGFLEEKKYDYQCGNIKYNLGYSVQNTSTDTIAVDLENKPVTDENGRLVFRPAGHGALIDNLNCIDADMVFIKNIDNVTTSKYLPETVRYKKIIGGYLLSVKNKINEILLELESIIISDDKLNKIKQFCINELGFELPETIDRELLIKLLDRPIRVCGVVKNKGEPGGGPFWVEKNGLSSKQIVESAQVDMNNDYQKDIWNSSTHFNPVDIVCWVKDYRERKFNLEDFIDKEAGIITQKSFEGKEIKALELPGLWNGAMAGWITLFVEVSQITFNPVKTVFDLLRKEHQN